MRIGDGILSGVVDMSASEGDGSTGLSSGRRGLRLVSLLLGAALRAWLVLSSDVRAIVSDLARVGPGIVVILALEFLGHAFNTLGWWFTLPVTHRAGNYGWLFWVRCAGQALNEATPLA